MGILERGGRVRAKHLPNVQKETLHNEIRESVELGSHLFTDQAAGYRGLKKRYFHKIINHVRAYVRGNVHTNGLENFWSLLKRGIKGTYVSVEPAHLKRYVDEQVFRFNERKGDDASRFLKATRSVIGRRLTYAQLIGEVQQTA
jgi:transposase-like protein